MQAVTFGAMLFLALAMLASAQDSCQAPCTAVTCNCNGKNYDFSVIQGPNTPWLEIKEAQGSDNYWYYLQLVNGGLPAANLPHCDWANPSMSQGNVAGQAKDPTTAKSCTALGMNSDPTPVWSINSQQNPQVVSITFTGGAPAPPQTKQRQTVLWVTCDPTQTGGVTQFTVDENPGLTYNYRLNHISACADAPPPVTTTASPSGGKGSGKAKVKVGWVLVGLLFGLSFVYFVGGILYNKYRNGASGREMVPNVEFWSSLPGLIKEGFRFTISKIRRQEYQRF